MTEYADITYTSADGLNLYARDYGNDSATLAVLCMPGLTRNSADFEDLCTELQRDYRIIAADLRGRGKSDWDRDGSHYQPPMYVQDMFTLIDTLELERVVLIGTSLGGLMAMMMNAFQPGRFAGIVLNDIGPEVNPAGLERIRSYVGKSAPVTSWAEAVEQCKATNGIAFPNVKDEDWARFARRVYGEDENGVPRLLYDPAISTPMNESDESAVPPDLWILFEAMATVPLLVIRGETSDILHPDCVTQMQKRKPDIRVFEVAGVGHAPMLDEPGVVAAILDLLSAAQEK